MEICLIVLLLATILYIKLIKINMTKANDKYFKDRGTFCSECGFYKFKTIKKGIEWECRKCRHRKK